tara:strand:+ start:6176 stop:6493 length:318 start_codon:yes stop_codon:yes gene_type:complete
MFTFNFNDLPKGITISGGLTPFKIILTSLKLRLLGYKPVKYVPAKTEFGYFIRKGVADEPWVRINFWWFGWKYSSFQAYNRNGKPRYTQSWYVPIKEFLIQKKVA